MPLNTFARSAARMQAAARFLAGGVSSNFRLGISPTPLVLKRADGPYLEDIDGNRLIDYYLGMGPMILGHRPPEVLEAVQRQLSRGILYGGQSELEFEAAELVCKLAPCAERVRFGSSGTEVVQAALRLARAATGRNTLIKFEGHYHGWLDNILWSVSPAPDHMGEVNKPIPQPGSRGQDVLCGQNIEVFPWNRADLLVERLASKDVAAIIMEPAMCNTGAILPRDGYLSAIRDACTRSGTVLIFDEVITGFRIAAGGAQQLFGVTPDLAVYGKALASGFPVACLAGRASLMDLFVSQNVMHGGTYNAQSIAMAATVATLKVLQQPIAFTNLAANGRRLKNGLEAALARAAISASVSGFPQIFHIAMGLASPPQDYRDLLTVDRARYVRLTTALLARNVRALERGAWFISTTHDEAVIDATIAAFQDALSTL